ncbi:MAG: ATP-binding protein, partial [Candidatus Sumerlaeaceae bacterium]|nr:ATP-binding protein [Candidatus Sumerlaeaceae bacterium]
LVETLLEMARHGENARKPPMDRLDFFSIVQDECMRLSEKALERQLRVVQHCGTQGAMVQSNEYLLRTIVRNLLGNAVDYAPEHTEITVEMNYDSARGGTLSISNYARDLSPADLENMTEPFWRKDSARTDRQHSGLGLTLAKSIAKLLDLRLSFSLSPGHLFTVTLQWPAPRE